MTENRKAYEIDLAKPRDAGSSISDAVMLTLLFFIFICSSWDKFMSINVHGYNIRLASIILIPLIISGAKRIAIEHLRIRKDLKWLFLAFTVNLFAQFGQGLHSQEVAQSLQFLYMLFLVCSAGYMSSRNELINIAISLYIYSFVAMGIFGIYQFFIARFGFIPYGVEQWWIEFVFPRVNGLSYEPSYYAQYMLIGWSVVYFRAFDPNQQSPSMENKTLYFIFSILSSAIVLSSSRVMIALMFAVMTYRLLLSVIMSRPYIFLLKLIIALMLSGSLLFFYVRDLDFYGKAINRSAEYVMTQNTGVAANGSNSLDSRINNAYSTFRVFLDHPILGVSFGGIPYEIAKERGEEIQEYSDYKRNQGNTVAFEVMAAVGLPGFIFFLLWLRSLIQQCFIAIPTLPFSKWTLPFIAGLLVEILAMQFNQNIFRLYFWIHVAFISVLSFNKSNYHSGAADSPR